LGYQPISYVSTQAFSVISFSTDNILFGTPVSYFFSKPQQDSEADKSAVMKFALGDSIPDV
jgi:hypothetical protein